MRIKGWEKFQHFKDRTPPWIKLYRGLLDDPEWFALDPEDARRLVMLWLIASEDHGALPDAKKLAFRLRTTETAINRTLTNLSHWLIQDDINVISPLYQVDTPETERETEKERENTLSPVPGSAPKKTRKPRCDEFAPEAHEILADYEEKIRRDTSKSGQGLKNISRRLSEGHTRRVLLDCVFLYGQECLRQGTEVRYRMVVSNFFGEKAGFLGFVSDAKELPPEEAING